MTRSKINFDDLPYFDPNAPEENERKLRDFCREKQFSVPHKVDTCKKEPEPAIHKPNGVCHPAMINHI